MRFRTSLALLLSTSALGCSSAASFVHTDTTLGRVVVYRNGVAYYERNARVENGELKLAVPADKVDDFLKSLTVVDARDGKPEPVSYPTSGTAADSEGLVRMTIQVPKDAPHDLKLSYVTEAPAWKPSYRITLGKQKKIDFQGWAIVDNTSGEDWTNVKLGVGSSSALSFRFDLRSVRLVSREMLQSDLPFAVAPPTGGSTYGYAGTTPGVTTVLTEMPDAVVSKIAMNDQDGEEDNLRGGGRGDGGNLGGVGGKKGGEHLSRAKPEARGPRPINGTFEAPSPPADEASRRANSEVSALTQQLKANKQKVVIEGFAGKDDADKNSASLERANRVRDQLINNGVSPDQVVAIGAGEQQGRSGGIRVVQEPLAITDKRKAGKPSDPQTSSSLSPIDTSHFESTTPMTVSRGTSAMVSIYNGETDGEVVYLYDPETQRGNATFPFRSVRIKNPTDSALESGPVTVFGEGRFIGEGLSDVIPPKSVAFVPFALDRQIVVEQKEVARDEIAKILTVQRGVFSTETKHIKKVTYTLTNRLTEPATVYVRHTVAQGYKLVKSPDESERLGEAHLFKVEIAAGQKVDVELEEATPVFQSTDIRTAQGMDLIKAFANSTALDDGLKGKVGDLIKLQEENGNFQQGIDTLHDQMGEYRTRMDELHLQIVTLKAVKTGGALMKNLEGKLDEISDKVSKATIDVVALQEQLMVNKIKFQDKVAELTLQKKEDKHPTAVASH